MDNESETLQDRLLFSVIKSTSFARSNIYIRIFLNTCIRAFANNSTTRRIEYYS
jgi:hypothetical protein